METNSTCPLTNKLHKFFPCWREYWFNSRSRQNPNSKKFYIIRKIKILAIWILRSQNNIKITLSTVMPPLPGILLIQSSFLENLRHQISWDLSIKFGILGINQKRGSWNLFLICHWSYHIMNNWIEMQSVYFWLIPLNSNNKATMHIFQPILTP